VTLLHSVDGVLVESVVGGDGSCLRSSQSLEGLVEVVLGDSVLLGGMVSEFVHVSSVGSSFVHGVLGLDVSLNGSDVVVMGLDVLVFHVVGVSDGLMVVFLGLIVVFLGELDLLDLPFESVVGLVEFVLVSVHSSSPVLGHSVSVSHGL